jgi:diamine N-acetyltransferase
MSHVSPATLRKATLDDAAELSLVGAATFTETFGHLYPPSDLAHYLLNSHCEEAWEEMLWEKTANTRVAEVDGHIVGFVVAGSCKLPVPDMAKTAGEIRQLYVLQAHHNQRLGTRLLVEAIEWLDGSRHAPLYVGVWSENYGAQRLYGRFGFAKVGEYDFPVGNTLDREFILRRE